MANKNNIAIIGAGIAGLSCATVLQKAGFNVTVFEKSRGVSGRLSTRITGHWQCDHGAQYFTARDPRFYEEVQRWIQANVAQLWQPNLEVFDGNIFTPKAHEKEANTLRYVGYPANNSPAKWLANTLNVQCKTTVTRIHKHAQQWEVSSKEHGTHTEYFDAVILAIPAPQTAFLLNNAVPTLAALCASVTMQPCFALMVHFNQKINCTFDGLFINTGLLSWVARDSAKPGRLKDHNAPIETWVLHASSQWSKAHVDDEKEWVAEQMLAAFIKIIQLNGVANAGILNASAQSNLMPQSHNLHRWLYADCANYLTNGYQFDSEQKIGLCGDWLNGGKVQGAWLSGLNLANKIIDDKFLSSNFRKPMSDEAITKIEFATAVKNVGQVPSKSFTARAQRAFAKK